MLTGLITDQKRTHSGDLRSQRVDYGNFQAPYAKEMEVMLMYSLD